MRSDAGPGGGGHDGHRNRGGQRLAGVVVAEVLTCVEHPDSDHLHITTVNDGSPEPVTVVCGAPNVAAGQKVLFARIGTVLPGDFKIKKSKIRGVESFGMICAEDELGIGASHDGIMVLPADSVVGTPAKEYLHLKEESVIEYEITANRIDAASHIGVARDVYAYLKSRDLPCALHLPSVEAFEEGEGEAIPVEVLDTKGAPRYTGITVKGVTVAPSPEWLQKKLLSIGLRPINNAAAARSSCAGRPRTSPSSPWTASPASWTPPTWSSPMPKARCASPACSAVTTPA